MSLSWLLFQPGSRLGGFLNDDILKFESSFDLLTCCLYESSCLGWHLEIRGCRVIAYYWLIASSGCLLEEESMAVNLESLNSQGVWLVSKLGMTGQDNSISDNPTSCLGVILQWRRKCRTWSSCIEAFTSAGFKVWDFSLQGFSGTNPILAPNLPPGSWGGLSPTCHEWEVRAGWVRASFVKSQRIEQGGVDEQPVLWHIQTNQFGCFINKTKRLF